MPQYNVLLVDDSRNILKALERALRGDGYRLFMAQSADEALIVLRSEEIDLIITDENMPGVSGTQLLEIVVEEHPEVIRFMITGATDIEVAKRAINQGAIRRFFSKPWDDFELQVAVQQSLEHRRVQRENKRLREIVQGQEAILRELEDKYPGISDRRTAEDGTYIID